MKSNSSKTYATTSIVAIALFSMSVLLPTNAMAAKQTTSGVHFQGPEPTISGVGTSTASFSTSTLAGLGQGSGTAVLTVQGFFDVTCANPGNNEDVPGQRTSAAGVSPTTTFTTDKNGKAIVEGKSATLQPPSSFPAGTCPNEKWTPSVSGSGTITSATLTITFNGQTIFTKTCPPDCA
jgi:hypothetical protein